MTKTKDMNKNNCRSLQTTRKQRRVKIKLNTNIVKQMVENIVKEVHGVESYGQLPYSFESSALQCLQHGAESFLEQMWEQLRHNVNDKYDNVNQRISIRDIQLWKIQNNFKSRFEKKNKISLCKIFKSHSNK